MKKQYKLIKMYPNLRADIELGLLVIKGEHSQDYYSNKGHIFSAEEIEDYPEFWSKIIEPVKLVKPIGTIFTVSCDNHATKYQLNEVNYDKNIILITWQSKYKTDPCKLSHSIETVNNFFNKGLWIEVKEVKEVKEYEILSYRWINCIYEYTINPILVGSDLNFRHYQSKGGGIIDEGTMHQLSTRPTIYSIKRLSDGEIFTIGDNVIHTNNVSNKNDIIEKFHIMSNGIWFKTNNYDVPMCYIKGKFKQPLFTTEDGVEIFNNQTKVFEIQLINYYLNSNIPLRCCNKLIGSESRYPTKVFSTKEKAEEYILMNKPCLSVNDIIKYIIDKEFRDRNGDKIIGINSNHDFFTLRRLAKSKI